LFCHVTVVPFGTVIVGGVNAEFWIMITGPSGICKGVVVGAAEGGLKLVHPHRTIKVTRITTRIAQFPRFGVNLIQITLVTSCCLRKVKGYPFTSSTPGSELRVGSSTVKPAV
jgi:hypothetical protein